MFTANSMNCLTEALGLALPGNGSTLATHAARRELFLQAGRTVMDLARRWYDHDDASALPRNIATRAAFENAMALDVAMGGSTNTVLHILAAAQEGEVDFDLAAIDAVSRRVPCLSKVAPNSDFHMEDVHRAGGIPAILGELRRGGLLNEGVHTVHSPSLEAWLDEWDVRAAAPSREAVELFHAAPGGVRTTEAFSTDNRWSSLDTDAEGGCIRDVAHAYTARRRPGRAARQHRPGRRGDQDRRHPRGAVALRGSGAGRRQPGGGRLGRPHQDGAARRRRSWCATRARPAARGCRRCCTPRRSSRAPGWAGCAR